MAPTALTAPFEEVVKTVLREAHRGPGPEEGGLTAIRTKLRMLRACQRGATAIEYGLIAALIVIVLIVSLGQLGGGANGMWTNIQAAIQAV